MEMERSDLIKLEGKIYSCKHCQAHLALSEDIMSKSFYCSQGKAYLFSKVVNVTVGEKVERTMTTGMHIVGDISCVNCQSIVGWKYFFAHEETQKYKEGKFVLERFQLFGPDDHSYDPNHEPQEVVSDADDA